MLTVKGLSFYYHPDRMILKDISFTLASHDILCLLGPNGTGKTTLIRCLLSLNKMKSGSIELDGQDLKKLSAKNRAKLMAYVPQATTMAFPYEAREVVLMGRVTHLATGGSPTNKDWELADEAMERLGILHMSRYLFSEMSGGEKQMVLLARALTQQAKIMIMDEPTANLDYSNQVKMLQVIRTLAGQGYSILMTSHFPDHAFLACNKAVLMRDGLFMAQGLPEDVVTTENLSRLYATPVCVTTATLHPRDEVTKVCIPIMNQNII
ncbi:ABC transporter ATP-binding protein [Desulfosporosinus youngiae]|uniref:ABC-type cobalamin/Fe3+-siderophore transport system, ATPase component n=1 Tax=Desulfosporosinus youngiae DSM 17734 TaxID=768710 RepID=H5XV99_9FIRM|nr:ABC transporter ATP-binding protein [Desulfosporosinus youngiae]EHQ89697.1 ABC-type cobalamin/Fe3+-siderophore transport system, ATPase component [Desulfosporosinus youngiae DSM 17734]